ncbi:MAG: RcnB family protein [Janthinobacterium lividum]
MTRRIAKTTAFLAATVLAAAGAAAQEAPPPHRPADHAGRPHGGPGGAGRQPGAPPQGQFRGPPPVDVPARPADQQQPGVPQGVGGGGPGGQPGGGQPGGRQFQGGRFQGGQFQGQQFQSGQSQGGRFQGGQPYAGQPDRGRNDGGQPQGLRPFVGQGGADGQRPGLSVGGQPYRGGQGGAPRSGYRPDGRGYGNRGDDNRGYPGGGYGGGGYGAGRGPGQGFRSPDRRDSVRDLRGFQDRADWNRGWRQDGRYDWSGYRRQHYRLFSLPRYIAPYGWGDGYRPIAIGVSLDAALYGPNYWISDPWAYRLPPAEDGLEWVRYYNDALLIDVQTGEVIDTVYGIFY